MARWQRKRRRAEQARRLQPPRPPESASPPEEELLRPGEPEAVPRRVEVASEVARLAYTPTQAAQALGISRSTLHRLLPYVQTVELPWGGTLVPVDELERLAAERRRAAAARRPRRPIGRKPTVPPVVVERIRVSRKAGMSLRAIAAELNRDQIPTGHGGMRWWPSTIRAVLRRAA